MKRNKLLYIMLFILLLGMTISAYGQGQGQIVERLRVQLERTDQMIERAAEAVRATNSAIALQPLENAKSLQEMAWTSFRAGTVEGYTAAAVQTRQALELAKKALSNARASQESDDSVQRRLERAAEFVERARELVGQSGNDTMRELLASLQQNLQRAWEFYRQGDLRPAVKLANQVEIAARKIINMAGSDVRAQNTFEQRRSAAGERMERAREVLSECQSQTGLRFLEQARAAFELSVQLARENQHDAALQALQNANKLASRAIEECGGAGMLQRRYDRLRTELDRLTEMVDPGNENAGRLIESAREQLELARRHLNANDAEAATAALRAAQLTLNQLQRKLGSDNF
jgi:hypothetical protein